MLISADAGRQNLRYIGICDGWKAVVNRPGGVGVPFIGDFTKRHNKGKDSVFVIKQISAEVTRLNAAETQSRSAGKTQRINRRSNVSSKRH